METSTINLQEKADRLEEELEKTERKKEQLQNQCLEVEKEMQLLQAEKNELEGKLQDLQSELSEERAQHGKALSEIENLRDEAAAKLDNSMIELQEKADRLEEELKEAERKREQLMNQYLQAEEGRRLLQAQMDELGGKVQDLQSELSEERVLHEKAISLEQLKCKEKSERISHLEQMMKIESDNLAKLANNNSIELCLLKRQEKMTKSSDLETIKNALKDSNDQVRALEEKLLEVETDKIQLASELSTAQGKASKLHSSKMDLEAKVVHLQARHNSSIQSLEQDLASARREIEVSKKENSGLLQSTEGMRTSIRDLEEQARNLACKIKTLDLSLLKEQGLVHEKAMQLDAKSKKVSRLERQLDDTKKKLSESKESMKFLEERLEAFQTTNLKLEQDGAQQVLEISTLKTQVQEQDHQLQTQRQQFSSLQRRFEQAQRQMAAQDSHTVGSRTSQSTSASSATAMRAKFNRLNKSLKQLAAQRKELEEKLGNANNRATSLERLIEEKNKLISIQQKNIAENSKRADELYQNLQEKGDEVGRLQKELDSAKASFPLRSVNLPAADGDLGMSDYSEIDSLECEDEKVRTIHPNRIIVSDSDFLLRCFEAANSSSGSSVCS